MNSEVLRGMRGMVFGLGWLAATMGFAAGDRPSSPVATATAAAKGGSETNKPVVNSLGMKFAPVPGTSVLFSVWETRVDDFAAFVKETGHAATDNAYSLIEDGWKQVGENWQAPGFPQTGLHPVSGVSWTDAKAFCAWLSKKEGRTYRLPTDAEWSAAVGLDNEEGASPRERSEGKAGRFPWGGSMPPLVGGKPAGNYAGSEASDARWPAGFRTTDGFKDSFPRTAPVGSFPANAAGLFDLGGNVWEWCEDLYAPEFPHRFVRGASWVDNLENILLSSQRRRASPDLRNMCIGFRCVLVPSK